MDGSAVIGSGEVRDGIVALLPRLRRFCLTLERDRSRAEDLCQATVERALARSDQFRPGTRLDSWIYRIAHNLRVDGARAQRSRGTEIDIETAYHVAGDDGVATVESRSDLDRARAALLALPEEQRMLMTLVVLDGMSYRDAAETLAIPIGTVMSRIARARRAIDLAINGDPTP